jgi:hypothetical protein
LAIGGARRARSREPGGELRRPTNVTISQGLSGEGADAVAATETVDETIESFERLKGRSFASSPSNQPRSPLAICRT